MKRSNVRGAKGQAIRAKVNLAKLAKRCRGKPVVPVRRTEQVLCDLIRSAEHRLTMTSFRIFQVPRLVKDLTEAEDHTSQAGGQTQPTVSAWSDPQEFASAGERIIAQLERTKPPGRGNLSKDYASTTFMMLPSPGTVTGM